MIEEDFYIKIKYWKIQILTKFSMFFAIYSQILFFFRFSWNIFCKLVERSFTKFIWSDFVYDWHVLKLMLV